MPNICISNESSAGEYQSITEVTRQYRLEDYATRVAAESALLGSPLCPLVDTSYSNLTRKDWSLSADAASSAAWTASVTWQEYQPREAGRERLSGSIAVTQQPIRYSVRHIGSYAAAGVTAKDAKGMINPVREGAAVRAEGAEIPLPVINFQITRDYAKGSFNTAFLRNAAYNYVAKPNTIAWREFGTGEIMLTAIDGSNDDGEFDTITFSFAASQTFIDLKIPTPFPSDGSEITIPQKLGWQYLHVEMIEQENGAGDLVYGVHTAHVDELQPGVDLNGLLP